MATEVGWIRRRWPGFRRRSAEARSCCGVSCVPPWRGGSSRVWPPRGLQSQGTCRASPDTRLEWLRRQGVCRGLGDSLFWSSVSGARSWAMVLLPSPLKAQKAMAAVPGHRGGVPGREVDLAPVGTQGLDETVAAPFERWRPVGLVHHLELKGDCVLGLCHRIPQQSSESGEGTVGDAHGQRADAIDLAWRGSEHGRTVECPALARQPWGGSGGAKTQAEPLCYSILCPQRRPLDGTEWRSRSVPSSHKEGAGAGPNSQPGRRWKARTHR